MRKDEKYQYFTTATQVQNIIPLSLFFRFAEGHYAEDRSTAPGARIHGELQ